MSFTLLHTADLHLGKSFGALSPERAEQRRADLLATLTRICRTGCEMQVGLICIAGDLFDRPLPTTSLLASTKHALAQADVPVLLIPGNHDPLDGGSPYLESSWPGNVSVANQSGWQRISVPDYEVWAFGYVRGQAHQSPWQALPACAPESLLALHAACLAPGLGVDAGYYNFAPDTIPPCGYLALGHHHRTAQVSRSPQAWYAGAPESLTAAATPATTLQVTMNRGDVVVGQLELATRRHRLVSIDVTGLSASAVWERALAEATTDDLLQLRFCGTLDVAESLDLLALRDELSARSFAADIDARELALPSELSGEGVFGTLQEITCARIRDLADDDPQRTRMQRALRYAALALEGRL